MIDVSELQKLEKNLAEISAQIGDRTRAMMLKVGAYVVSTVEKRYKDSGPNSEGAPFYPILLSSYLARAKQKTEKGNVRANWARGAKYAKMAGMDVGTATEKRVRIPNSMGHPLFTTAAKHSEATLENNGYTVVITPTRKTKKGEYVVSYFMGDHPTMFNRYAHYLNNKDKNDITELAEKELAKFIADGIKK